MENINSFEKLKKLSTGLSVLFMEKDKKFHEAIENIFNDAFSSVYRFFDEASALERYSLIKPDLLVLGLPLAKANAIEFIADIRQINPDANIVVISDNNEDFELLHTIDFGIMKLILKPLSPNQLVNYLSSVLEDTEQPRIYKQSLKFLQNIKEKNKELIFNNSYKGIPISSEGTIESIDENTFTVKLSEIQKAAVKYESHTVLKAGASGRFVHAYLLSLDERRSIARFTKPHFIDFTQRSLSNKRLKVDSSFKLGFFYKNKNIEAFAEDISLGAISIFIDTVTCPFSEAENIDLTLGFDIDTAVISNSDRIFVKVFAKGKVIRTEPYKNGFKVISSLSVAKADQSNFKKYIKYLEMKIIEEFKYLVRR